MLKSTFKEEWLEAPSRNIISGIVVGIAIIPEAIGFSIIAGVNPMVGLYASLIFSIVLAIFGGRTGMISAATSAMALVIVSLVKDYGVEYLFAAAILAGILQFIFGILKVSKLMRFVPRTVMIGFVNALAILIFASQLPYIIGTSSLTYIYVIAALLILYLFPRITKKVPSPLIAIIVLTAIAIVFNLQLETIGDIGQLNGELPKFGIPNVPFTFETLKIIFPYSLSLSIVGLLESMLTSRIIDDMTDTISDKNREAKGQGLANIIAGFFGGMPGCAMIGQSMVNMKSGGRTRLSTFTVGIFLLIAILFFTDIIMKVPISILVGIMIMVSISTFDWNSFSYLKKMPKSDSFVMIATVIVVIMTHDLSKGVGIGVILSAIFFVIKISKVYVTTVKKEDKTVINIRGELFFASVESFISQFDFNCNNEEIIIDFQEARVWDDSAVGAIDKVVLKFMEKDCKVSVENLNTTSKKLVDDMAVFNQENPTIKSH